MPAKSCAAPVVAETLTKRNAVHINQDRRSFHNLTPSGRRRRRVVPSTDSASLIARLSSSREAAVYSILRPSFWTDTTRLPVNKSRRA
ncbi:hypothetical protein ECDEC11D_2349 [Escherichia coli DEC11D]|nr:hypothetical protein ECDEC11D_2349 [Escherichia coli DEC11D]